MDNCEHSRKPEKNLNTPAEADLSVPIGLPQRAHDLALGSESASSTLIPSQ
jgi:hypothetical protein